MSRKGKREERLIRGDEILEGRGIDLDAPDETLLPALVAAIGTDPDADLSIADWMGSIASDEAARRLREWEARSTADKDLKRILRASLFRLQQKGIAIAAREEPAPEPVRLIDPVEPRGYLSAMDGAGSRLAWLTRPRPEGGMIVLTSIVNDRTGMRQIDARLANKAQLKELLGDAARHQLPLVEAPHRYVDWLMNDAYRRGVPREEAAGSYPLLRAELYQTPAGPVPNPVDAMMGASTQPPADDAKLLDESAKLFDEIEFAGWAVPEEMVKVHMARFRDAQDSTLVLSKQQMTERLTQIIDQAFDEVIAGEMRAIYASRMAEMALWYLLAKRDEPARACYAVSRALADKDRRLTQVSFLRALIFRSFLPLMPRGDKPEGSESAVPEPDSLLVRPD
ncbi:MAG TPA: hypothetical protein VFP98_10600 [Candidatus Polarisedimenticolia bacterium]|nr:hypothetical protein [Candidatus Polarisedimenticolia bacterium]